MSRNDIVILNEKQTVAALCTFLCPSYLMSCLRSRRLPLPAELAAPARPPLIGDPVVGVLVALLSLPPAGGRLAEEDTPGNHVAGSATAL